MTAAPGGWSTSGASGWGWRMRGAQVSRGCDLLAAPDATGNLRTRGQARDPETAGKGKEKSEGTQGRRRAGRRPRVALASMTAARKPGWSIGSAPGRHSVMPAESLHRTREDALVGNNRGRSSGC